MIILRCWCQNTKQQYQKGADNKRRVKKRESKDHQVTGIQVSPDQLRRILDDRAQPVIGQAIKEKKHFTLSKVTINIKDFKPYETAFNDYLDSKFGNNDFINFLDKKRPDQLEAIDNIKMRDQEEWAWVRKKVRGPIFIAPEGSSFGTNDFRPGGVLYPYLSKKCIAFEYSQYCLKNAEKHIHESDLFDEPGNTLVKKAGDGCHDHDDPRAIICATFVTTVDIFRMIEDGIVVLNAKRSVCIYI